jgi:hypothetical protein
MTRKLFEKGVDQEAILIAIEAAEQVMAESACTREEAFVSGVLSADVRGQSRDHELENRREADRIRKQRSRDRHALSRDDSDMSRDVTNASLCKEEKKEGIKEEIGATSQPHPRTNRGQRLPDGWRPTPQDWATSGELLSEPRAKSELEKFTDHWKQQPGSKGVKLDWNAAWRNWTRRAAEYGARPNGKTSQAQDTFGGFSGLAAQLRRKIADQEADDDAGGQGSVHRR